MSELNLDPKINNTPAVIDLDYEGFKAQLEQHLAQYNTVVTADTVKDAKALATELNALKTRIDDKRKEAVKYVSAPIKAADTKLKELVQLVEDGRQGILTQVRVFDEKRLEKCRELLSAKREALFGEYAVADEFRRAEFDDLVKLTALTAKDNLAAAPVRELSGRVRQDRELQDTVERRLLELENASYKAGLASPLTRAHVEHFLEADDATYAEKLQALLDVEIQRDRDSREAIARQAERDAPKEPEDPGLFDDLGHGGCAVPEPEPAPEPVAEDHPVTQSSGESERYTLTVTMSATLPAGMTEEQIRQQFREFIEGPGNTQVDFMMIEKDEEAHAA